MNKRFHDEPIKVLVTCPKCSHSHTITIPENELPDHQGTERYYKLAEIEKMLGVTRRTVKQWIYDKKLRAVKLSEGSAKGAPWFVPASALRDFRLKNRK